MRAEPSARRRRPGRADQLGAGCQTCAVDAVSAVPNYDRSKEPFVQIVEIYTKMTCPFCWRAKHLLTAKGIEFTEIEVDWGGPEREVMIQCAKGRTTVPQIFVGEVHVGGCDDLLALERDGKLDALVAASA